VDRNAQVPALTLPLALVTRDSIRLLNTLRKPLEQGSAP
jgi:hypothetical protein